jgi:phosphatidylserine synthase 2
MASILTELLIVMKFGHGAFPNPAPPLVVYFWLATGLLLILYPIYQFWVVPRFLAKHPSPHLKSN